MTDLTRVSAYDNLNDAETEAFYWKNDFGYHVVVVGPTDAIEFSKGDDVEDKWESGKQSDWYLVIASNAEMKFPAKK